MSPAYQDALPAGALLRKPGAAGQEWSCRLLRKPGRRATLYLSGSLHVAWAGRLAAGLASRDISVVRAIARGGAERWEAEIDLDLRQGGVEPSAIDFIALMREQPDPADAGELALTSSRVTPRGNGVQVEIRGRDAVGLGRVLRLFAEQELFPREMRVETLRGAVRDHFLLQDRCGASPAAGAIAALRARLEAFVRP
jgi:hypothetical protein